MSKLSSFAPLGAALVLAGTAGFFVAASVGTSAGPAQTVTVNVPTGATGPTGPPGPTGPAGPPGPAGGNTCPAGYAEGSLVINHPGGQVTLWTCLHT